MSENPKSSVKFTVNGKQHIVKGDYGPEFSLNNYLRNELNLRGTKAMCHEGGCGACVVSIKAIHPATKEQQTFSVNSCLIPVFSCHGWEITTVEGIGNRNVGYHPVQKRLATFNGTQCGYCTPGWVMSMYSMLEGNKGGLTTKDVENSFAGNLCRCTGYRPIADAFKSFATNADPKLIAQINDMEDLDLFKGCSNKCGGKNICKSNFETEKALIGKFSCLYDTEMSRNRKNSDEDWCMISEKANLTEDIINIKLPDGHKWIKVYNIDDLFKVLKGVNSYMFLAGCTGHGVYHIKEYPESLIDISSVEELKGHTVDVNLVLGAGMTLTEMMEVFLKMRKENEDFFYLETFHKHMDLVAHFPVRNVGTIGGNLSLKHQHNDFQSDVFLLFETVGAMMTLLTGPGVMTEVTMIDYLKTDMRGKVILNVKLPPLSKKSCLIQTYKIMPRAQNAHALVNAGFLFKYDENLRNIQSARIVYGSIAPDFNHAKNTEAMLVGKNIFNNETLQLALNTLSEEIFPEAAPPEPKPAFRKLLAITLFYKAVIHLCPTNVISPRIKSGGEVLKRELSSGVQSFETNKSVWPLNKPIPKLEALIQCSGEAKYSNDMETQPDEVYAAFVLANVPNGNILGFDTKKAEAFDGFVAFYTHKDIPGKNTFTPTEIPLQAIEEEILCSGKVLYNGQPVAIVVAKTEKQAKRAAELVDVKYSTVKSYKPVLSIRDALKAPDSKERLLHVKTVEPTDRGTNIKKVILGEFYIGTQYHYTFETQTAVVRPTDDGFEVHASTQWIDLTNTAVAQCLGIPLNQVKVIVRRLGGAYGGKITRATQVACGAAIVSQHLNTTCRFVLPIETNMRAVGKRLAALTKFEVGVSNEGEIQYLNNTLYQDDGCTHNEGIIYFTLNHINSCYDAKRWKIDANAFLTDTASNTWTRAPGSTEGIAISEFIMEMIAHETKVDPTMVKIKNMRKEDNPLPELIETLKNDAEFDSRSDSIRKFNAENRWRKRTIKLVPMVYPVDYFGNWSVLVSVYHADGSVSVSHSGIEMGQGLNTKVAQVIAFSLGIPLEKVSIKPSDSVTSPNAFVSGGSIASESVCYAAVKACQSLQERLKPVRASMTNAPWEKVVDKAYAMGVDLRSTASSTPATELMKYDVFGVTILELELDLLTGNHLVLRVDLLEDTGESLSPQVDIGQIEGAFVMGLGYWTSEQVIFDQKTGAVLTDRTWTYKPPGIKDIPVDFRVYFRRNAKNASGVLRSKATGEPATCMSVVVMHALREAVKLARAETSRYKGEWVDIEHPCTTEHLMMAIRHKIEDFVLY